MLEINLTNDFLEKYIDLSLRIETSLEYCKRLETRIFSVETQIENIKLAFFDSLEAVQ